MGLRVIEEIDSRRVTPNDVVDALKGAIDAGKVERVIVVTEAADGTLLTTCSDMTNTEYVGTLTIAMSNYVHGFQHED